MEGVKSYAVPDDGCIWVRMAAIDEKNKQIAALKKENDDLRCCGNCKGILDPDCPRIERNCDEDNICDKWQSDQMTRSEREIK